MEILIKSFNRPYYLDRCIQSIKLFVADLDYKIIVLDDGTPQRFLDKIKEKHPEITILKSENYIEKSTAIENNLSPKNNNIPIDLWMEAAKNTTNFFVLLEDDIWFTKPIHLNQIEQLLDAKNIQILKLYWLGNQNLIFNNVDNQAFKINFCKPKLYISNPFLYQIFFGFYRFKTRKIFKFLGIYSNQKALDYYKIYATAGAIFNKKYFLSLWNNHKNTVDEGLQILNAVKFVNKNKNISFGNLKEEVLKTGFCSSATNNIKNYQNVSIDMFAFNKIINNYWYENNFDVMKNFSNDLDITVIDSILEKENNSHSLKTEWQKWVAAFKNQYVNFGCKID